jgi:hypothetical protein
MKVYDLVSRVEERTDSHSQTLTYLNKGLLELATEAQNVEKANITFTNGVASIPATCLEPLAILLDGRRLDLRPLDMYIYDNASDPDGYTVKNGQIVLNTKVSETLTDGLLYIPRPTTLDSNEDVPAYSSDADEALVAYGRYKVYADLEYPDKAKYWYDIWLAEKENWLKLHKKQNPRVRKVRPMPYV